MYLQKKLYLQKKYNIIFNIVLFIVTLFIILFILCESDRNFNGNIRYPMYFYYIQIFPMPIVGLYNTLIRLTNPHHTHIFNVNDFNSNTLLQSNWKIIQKEALNIYSKKDKLLNMKDIGIMGSFDEIDKETGKWKVFVLKWYDGILDNARKLCPETTRLIDKCGDVHAAMFSIIEPGKYIPLHKGPSTACLRYHLGLKIPKDEENCYIIVNKQKYHWQEGKSFIFDDTYNHAVYNNTNEARIILFIDIERPLPPPIKYLNNYLCKNVAFSTFVKGVNDVSEKTLTVEGMESNIHFML